MPSFDPVPILRRKRDGLSHPSGEIRALIRHYMSGDVADYQISAWLMAAYLEGLDARETLELTEALLHSGKMLEHDGVSKPIVDKHSTGGVGDKISICLAPLVAACGVAVPMISGRGLGHTGGTLDKLEAIPGFNVQLTTRRFQRQLERLGLAMIGQTRELAPADRRLYALRDVTGTVESIPLIVASILSKKLAAGIQALVLDVKVGRGAFMKELASARQLARALVRVGKRAGKRVVALLTDMDQPLGFCIGNALETREALEVLHGRGPADVRELTLVLGEEMLLAAGKQRTRSSARAELESALGSGRALELMAKMVAAQGGDSRCVADPRRLPGLERGVVVRAGSSGSVRDVDPLALAHCALALGAGRTRVDQKLDLRAGIELSVRRGDPIRRGQPLCRLYSALPGRARELEVKARAAFSIGAPPRARALVLETLRAG